MNYRVYVKASEHAPWRFSGVVESDKAVAHRVWADIIKRLRYHAYRLKPCTHGVCIER